MASLVERVFKGGAWVGALRVLQKGVGFGRKIILARLLFPDDFGLFGIALLLLEGFRVLTQTGFKDALIHVRERVNEYLHTSYWIQIFQGLITGLLVYVGAPLVAQFFSEPRVVPIVRVLALARVVYGFRSIGVVVLERDLDFRTASLYRLSGTLTFFSVAVALAILWRDVWALVWGKVASRSVMVAVSYYVHPYRPRLLFNRQRAIEILNYGVWLLGAGIVSYIALQADNVVAGRIVGTSALGVYQMGYVISSMPTTEISKQIGKVVQPGFAELQSDPKRMRRMFRKVVLTVLAVILPLGAGLALTTPSTVFVVLGKNWKGVIPILPILVVGGVFRALSTTLGSLFKAMGETSLLFKSESARAVTLMGGLLLCIIMDKGLVFISYSFVFSAFSGLIIYIYIADIKLMGLREVIGNTLPTVMSVLIMTVVIIIAKKYILISPNITNLSLKVIIGSISYVSSHLILEKGCTYKPITYLYNNLRQSFI